MLAGLMLGSNGTFIYWKYHKLALAAGVLLMVGVFMKIMHWQGADEMLFVSLPLIPAIYSAHFFSKRNKAILDILKWCMILFPFILAPMTLFHWVDLPVLVTKAPVYFYWFTFVFFIVTRLKDKTLFLD
ncbi:hypothetical protein [Chryseolinea soli]|uniref:Uncharacterized protein n=1 Tax=Chryseolinea soli TaxID=2321403 RepID=A0A385SV35_9BACT|nr:hypothetical protein [Chryseolinea soli]AYB34784.1 hypothetical protein D4L85_31245 [Chryseolinea soli]